MRGRTSRCALGTVPFAARERTSHSSTMGAVQALREKGAGHGGGFYLEPLTEQELDGEHLAFLLQARVRVGGRVAKASTAAPP